MPDFLLIFMTRESHSRSFIICCTNYSNIGLPPRFVPSTLPSMTFNFNSLSGRNMRPSFLESLPTDVLSNAYFIIDVFILRNLKIKDKRQFYNNNALITIVYYFFHSEISLFIISADRPRFVFFEDSPLFCACDHADLLR